MFDSLERVAGRAARAETVVLARPLGDLEWASHVALGRISTEDDVTLKYSFAHDYFTQMGGAERVAAEIAQLDPTAPIFSLLASEHVTSELGLNGRVSTSWLQKFSPLKQRHTAAFPLIPRAAQSLAPSGDVLIASTSGWAHRVPFDGMKVAYVHTPARWIYEPARFRGRGLTGQLASIIGPMFRPGDQWAASTCSLLIANSRHTASVIRSVYGRDAPIVHPPIAQKFVEAEPTLDGDGSWLMVSRLQPYKGITQALDLFRSVPEEELIVVGEGPQRARYQAMAPPNVTFLGRVGDEDLLELYGRARGLLALGREDFGLTPIEAAALGTPTLAWRDRGYLETVIDGVTGTLVPRGDVGALSEVVRDWRARPWRAHELAAFGDRFSPSAFRNRLEWAVREHLT